MLSHRKPLPPQEQYQDREESFQSTSQQDLWVAIAYDHNVRYFTSVLWVALIMSYKEAVYRAPARILAQLGKLPAGFSNYGAFL